MQRMRWYRRAAAFLVAATMCPVIPTAAGPLVQSGAQASRLSPYWGSAIVQWEPVILEEAERRGLDPDLIAAVIWKESSGRSYVRGPAGAVGLMMVMPREAGFSWRPTVSELQDPWRNVFWGARALSIIICQGHGDLYSALAAYNGGWEQIHLGSTRRYAEDVLGHYIRAIAVRFGLSPEGHWVATLAATNAPEVLTVLGPQRPFARYSRRPIMADIPDATTAVPPSAVTFRPVEEEHQGSRVGLWVVQDGRVMREVQQGPGGEEPSRPSPGPMESGSLPVARVLALAAPAGVSPSDRRRPVLV